MTPLPECAGWFGKIPSLGDFVTGPLPPAFIERWDAWLSGELWEAQQTLGESWAAAYRQAPIWCFFLGPGVIDARSWRGILVSSFDRVGREFPLTIAFGSAAQGESMRGPTWWTGLVAIGRRAVAVDGSVELLRETLAEFIRAQDHFAPGTEVAEVVVPVAGSSRWWPARGEGGGAPVPTVTTGLPRGESFRALVGRPSPSAPDRPPAHAA